MRNSPTQSRAAVESIDPKLILFAPDKSELARAGEAHGLQIAREIFADRNYLNDGWLVSRTRPDALLHDPKEAAERVLRMLREGKVAFNRRPRCRGARRKRFVSTAIHPAPVEFARELRTRLEREGVKISAPKSSRVTKTIVILSEAKNLRSLSRPVRAISQRC